MGLVRNYHCWEVFSQQFGIGWFYGGEILLSYGDWKVSIHTKIPLKEVWISMAEPEDCTPVCCGDVTLVGSRIFSDHVEVNAKVRSDIVVLDYWFRY
jgi:hypothetical protein